MISKTILFPLSSTYYVLKTTLGVVVHKRSLEQPRCDWLLMPQKHLSQLWAPGTPFFSLPQPSQKPALPAVILSRLASMVRKQIQTMFLGGRSLSKDILSDPGITIALYYFKEKEKHASIIYNNKKEEAR